MNVETVRMILERTFQMPVAESDAQIVLDRLEEIGLAEQLPTVCNSGQGDRYCAECHALLEEKSVYCDNCGTETF